MAPPAEDTSKVQPTGASNSAPVLHLLRKPVSATTGGTGNTVGVDSQGPVIVELTEKEDTIIEQSVNPASDARSTPGANSQDDKGGTGNDQNSQDSVPWSETFKSYYQKVRGVGQATYKWADDHRSLSCLAAGLGLGGLGVYTVCAGNSRDHNPDILKVLRELTNRMYRSEVNQTAILNAIGAPGSGSNTSTA